MFYIYIYICVLKKVSEQRDGGLKCCAAGKPENLSRIERMCSVMLSANRLPVFPM